MTSTAAHLSANVLGAQGDARLSKMNKLNVPFAPAGAHTYVGLIVATVKCKG